MPAILAILTFSKQMDINWDYIKDAQRDIYTKLTVEYRSVQVLQPKQLVTPCRNSLPSRTNGHAGIAKRFGTNHRKENIIYTASREPVSMLISSYQLLCDHSRLNQP